MAGRKVWPLGRNPTGYTQRQGKDSTKPKKTETDTEENDEDVEEMPETIGRQTYDTSERNGRYVPIQTNPEDDALQLHTDGEIPGKNNKYIIRRSNRNVNKPNRYGSIQYTGNFWG